MVCHHCGYESPYDTVFRQCPACGRRIYPVRGCIIKVILVIILINVIGWIIGLFKGC